MNLNPIASNMTELELRSGLRVLFSYRTPVACEIDGVFHRSRTKWSATTTRHINKWLESGPFVAVIGEAKPQEFFDNLIAEVK